MPANLSPEYRKAEQAFRSARDPHERLECLKEMLRTIPRHKGTEHIQADIRSRLRQLTDDLGAPHKGPARSAAAHAVRHEGAAQVCLVGPPNSGKSSLHALLTGSKAESGPFPYTTKDPLPGMLPFQDIAFQLVDLPPITAEHMDPWLPRLLQSTDAVWLVVDIADAECTEQVLATCSVETGRHGAAVQSAGLAGWQGVHVLSRGRAEEGTPWWCTSIRPRTPAVATRRRMSFR